MSCNVQGCPVKYAIFAESKESKERYCTKHKNIGMIDVLHKRCEHNRIKSACKDCDGNQFCKHKRQRSRCKDCGGNSLCKHKKRKELCKDCDGSQICHHKKRKETCKECDGSQICEHKILKLTCKECKGSQVCPHGRRKSTCKDCVGGSICKHNQIRYQCKECEGSQICEHKKKKSRCINCDGSEICEHKKIKSYCKYCKGSQICKHGEYKARCKECGGSALCKYSLCKLASKRKYEKYCLKHFIIENPDKPVAKNYKIKEKEVVDFIVSECKHNNSWICNKRIKGGCSLRVPDMLLDLDYQVVIVEIDENQHKSYDLSCERKRIADISNDVGNKPVIYIRFNPDGYIDENKNKISGCFGQSKDGKLTIKKSKQNEWITRLKTLKEQIQYWFNNQTTENKIIHLFFDSK